MMRSWVFAAVISAFSAAAIAQPATRPVLASGNVLSAGSLTDLAPSGSAEDIALYRAVQSLIERYGLSGVSYADKTVRGKLTITADEARAPLLSYYAVLEDLVNANIDDLVSESKADDDSIILKKIDYLRQNTLAPAQSCQLLVGTKYAAATKNGTPKGLAGNASVTWAQALACLPGGAKPRVEVNSYNLKPVTPQSPITRGEFLHKLNEAADNALEEMSWVLSDEG
jgi:hypothetical protein